MHSSINSYDVVNHALEHKRISIKDVSPLLYQVKNDFANDTTRIYAKAYKNLIKQYEKEIIQYE